MPGDLILLPGVGVKRRFEREQPQLEMLGVFLLPWRRSSGTGLEPSQSMAHTLFCLGGVRDVPKDFGEFNR